MSDTVHIEPGHRHRPAFAAWGLSQDPPLQTASTTGWNVPLDLYPSVPAELLEGGYVDGFPYGGPDVPQPTSQGAEGAVQDAEDPVQDVQGASANAGPVFNQTVEPGGTAVQGVDVVQIIDHAADRAERRARAPRKKAAKQPPISGGSGYTPAQLIGGIDEPVSTATEKRLDFSSNQTLMIDDFGGTES